MSRANVQFQFPHRATFCRKFFERLSEERSHTPINNVHSDFGVICTLFCRPYEEWTRYTASGYNRIVLQSRRPLLLQPTVNTASFSFYPLFVARAVLRSTVSVYRNIDKVFGASLD